MHRECGEDLMCTTSVCTMHGLTWKSDFKIIKITQILLSASTSYSACSNRALPSLDRSDHEEIDQTITSECLVNYSVPGKW